MTNFPLNLSISKKISALLFDSTVKISLTILILFCYSLSFCQESTNRLLNPKERFDYARKDLFPTAKTLFKDTIGNILRGFNWKYPVIGNELYAASDYYVDGSGKIVEVVVRKPTASDKVLIKKLYDLEEEKQRGSMELITIDCRNEKEILAEVLLKETENRKNEQVVNPEVDNNQEATVMSLLQQCGEPSLALVGPEGVRAIFQVLQHARRKNQEKYFSVVESFLRSGNIRKGASVGIEDRLLMTGGSKQRYGTQIVFFPKTGYRVFPIEDPDHVDERRAALGLSTLEEYLKEREEFYGMEIGK